jgi:GT2 family glycosyltransferase
MLLNNDAFVTPAMLEILMSATEPDIGLISPKIFYEDHPNYLWFAGAEQHPYLLEMHKTGQGKQDGPRWQQTRDVDYLVGTGLLVNITAVAQVGLFDERYFMYYEDLDWSIRLRQAGLRLRLVANAFLYHRVSFSTGGQNTPAQLYYQAKSSIIFFSQHAHEGSPFLILLFRLGSTCKRIGSLLWQRNMPALFAFLRGLRDGWQKIKKG